MRKELSLKQLEANRRNAMKSTGPRTSEGKAVVRRNAITHGIFADDFDTKFPAPDDTGGEFRNLLLMVAEEYQPVGFTENMLVERIAVSYWRLQRARRAENQALLNSPDPMSRPPIQYIEVSRPTPGDGSTAQDGEDTASLTRDQLVEMVNWLKGDAESAREALYNTSSWRSEQQPPALPNRGDMERILKYEITIERQLYKALDQLERAQRQRRGELIPPPVNIHLENAN